MTVGGRGTKFMVGEGVKEIKNKRNRAGILGCIGNKFLTSWSTVVSSSGIIISAHVTTMLPSLGNRDL